MTVATMALTEAVKSLLERALTSFTLKLGGEGCCGHLCHLRLILHLGL